MKTIKILLAIFFSILVAACSDGGSEAPTGSIGSIGSTGSTGSIAPGAPSAPTIVAATAGNARIVVEFTAPVSNGGSAITSYTATCGAVSAPGAASPVMFTNNVVTDLNVMVTGLDNRTPYTCTVTATNAVGTGAASAVSNSVTPIATIATKTKINDTGQTRCYNDTVEVDCATLAATHPRQDALFGRDAQAAAGTLTKTGASTGTGSNATGFDFTRVCMDGSLNCATAASNAADPALTDWACTKDNNTGLTWSLETQVAVWAEATTTLPAAANAAIRCGFSDWRLPTRRELLSIVHNDAVSPANYEKSPAIDTAYFPATVLNSGGSRHYWSNDTYALFPICAWGVYFAGGSTVAFNKTFPGAVRLVRSGGAS